jgi:hypothetical protein
VCVCVCVLCKSMYCLGDGVGVGDRAGVGDGAGVGAGAGSSWEEEGGSVCFSLLKVCHCTCHLP